VDEMENITKKVSIFQSQNIPNIESQIQIYGTVDPKMFCAV
jgi:hypothetical protein